jgi:hypothetical protein
MPKKVFPIKYTSRDFDSIKADLIEYAKKYYPNTYRDFSDASFGSLMFDTVSYVGDILSFYLDYQVNESFLQSAVEYNNVLRLGNQMGYKYRQKTSSSGTATFYIQVPVSTVGTGPDITYAPILKAGTQLSSESGAGYILTEDVNFADPGNEIVVAQVDATTGLPTFYAIRAFGSIISGRLFEETITVGNYEPFLKVETSQPNVAEIFSVYDAEGHRYYEVEFLSQDTIYKEVTNATGNDKNVRSLLKPFVVPRRFVVERTRSSTFLRFGASSDVSLPRDQIADPSNVVLRQFGKDYITEESFDPNKLTATEKFGVAPSNTTLILNYRVSDSTKSNARIGSVNKVTSPIFDFTDINSLNDSKVTSVITSLDVENEEQIVGEVLDYTRDELKELIMGNFAAQNRAVTARDYESLVYQMPKKFGSVKRCKILRDPELLRNNLNLYVIAEDSFGKLIEANSTIKQNLKVWLTQNKMISDTIDIIDARVINIGINFTAIGDFETSKAEVLTRATDKLISFYQRLPDIGEAFFITDVYNELRKIDGIVDVTDVKVTLNVGGDYSDTSFNLKNSTSPDGRYIEMPKNVIWEIKFPNSDIKGVIK